MQNQIRTINLYHEIIEKMTEVKNKLLARHMENMKDVLLKYSNFIIPDAKHPVNLGSAREGLIANFLAQTLPDNIQYHTGEIFDSFDEHSGQVDIILHPIGSPKINLFGSINIFPFENTRSFKKICLNSRVPKSASTLFSALTSCELVKKLSHYSRDINESIPFVLFSYSNSKGSDNNDSLARRLRLVWPILRVLPAFNFSARAQCRCRKAIQLGLCNP